MKYLNLTMILLFVIIADVSSQYDWTRCESGTVHNLNHVVWNGHNFIAAGADSSIFISQDGLEWEKREIGLSVPYAVVTYNKRDEKTLISTYGLVYISDDGEQWNNYTTNKYETSQRLIWGNDEYIHINKYDIDIMCSTDGRYWRKKLTNTSPGHWMYDITWSGEKYLVVGDYGYNYIASNSNDWLNYSGKGYLSTVTWMNDKFIGCHGLDVKTSIDGINWETKKLPVPLWDTTNRLSNICKIRWTGELLIYLNGLYIATSPDGENWTFHDCKIPFEDSLKFNDVAFNDSVFVAVGDKGLIATSKIEAVSNSLQKNIVGKGYNFGLQISEKRLIVNIEKGNHFSAEIFDAKGKSVRNFSKRDISSKEILLDINEKSNKLSNGRYILKVNVDGKQFARKFIYVN